MANGDREYKEGEDRGEGAGGSGGEVGAGVEQDGSVTFGASSGAQQGGGVTLDSTSGAESPSPTTEGDPPIIIQGGGNT